MDNANLDKARLLLAPIKAKFGAGLSWGDLFVLAGTTAIEDMGGPSLGFCGGRVDSMDGAASFPLGTQGTNLNLPFGGASDLARIEQTRLTPCNGGGDSDVNSKDGQCSQNSDLLAQDLLGLIYVHPSGTKYTNGANPDPAVSARFTRSTFSRMAHDDYNTVALIGGGHAFGKAHGGCSQAADSTVEEVVAGGGGKFPYDAPLAPWVGNCGTPRGGDAALKGKGPYTYTAGEEGSWTTNPTRWDNEYFQTLQKDWDLIMGPGNVAQWWLTNYTTRNEFLAPSSFPSIPAPEFVDEPVPPGKQMLMFTTADISIGPQGKDPEYTRISLEFAGNQSLLDEKFAGAWYKLTSQDKGPVSRCIGSLTPPEQPWQGLLGAQPKPADVQFDYAQVVAAVEASANAVIYFKLAYACSTSYRETDHFGGCNGGFMRFEQTRQNARNSGYQLTNPATLFSTDSSGSIADQIVAFGTATLSMATGVPLPFCPGRTDAPEWQQFINHLVHRANGFTSLVELENSAILMDLQPWELVALNGAYHALTAASMDWSNGNPGTGAWGGYFSSVVSVYDSMISWGLMHPGEEYTRVDGIEYSFFEDPVYLTVVQEFAADAEYRDASLKAAWTKMVTADRFDGPTGNLCTNVDVATASAATPSAVSATPSLAATATHVRDLDHARAKNALMA